MTRPIRHRFWDTLPPSVTWRGRCTHHFHSFSVQNGNIWCAWPYISSYRGTWYFKTAYPIIQKICATRQPGWMGISKTQKRIKCCCHFCLSEWNYRCQILISLKKVVKSGICVLVVIHFVFITSFQKSYDVLLQINFCPSRRIYRNRCVTSSPFQVHIIIVNTEFKIRKKDLTHIFLFVRILFFILV